MNETTVVALVVALTAALPPTLVALATLIQARKAAIKADAAIGKADEAVVRAQVTGHTLITKTAEIHELTNSNLTAVKAELAIALLHIKELQQVVATLTHRPQTRSSPKGRGR